MIRLGTALLLALTSLFVALPAVATADGTPDTTFSGDGLLTLDPVPGFDALVTDMAVDSKGRILIAGSTNKTGQPARGFVLRLLDNGAPDVSFGTGGYYEVNAGDGTSTHVSGIALDSKGRIAVGGFAKDPPRGFDFFVTRLLEGGTADPAFVNNTLDFGASASDTTSGVAVDQKDRIVVTGSTIIGTQILMAVARFTANGMYDLTFNGSGHVIPPVGGIFSTASSVTTDLQGRILVSGSRQMNVGSGNAVALRLLDGGGLDPSFSGDGIASVDFGSGGIESANDIALDGKGRPVMAGYTKPSPPQDLTVSRLLPDGDLDQSFSGDGLYRTTTTRDEYGNSVAIDRADRILAGGGISSPVEPADAMLSRFNDAGVDLSFGANGILREDYLATTGTSAAVAIDLQGRYLTAGLASGPGEKIGVARYTVDYPKPPGPGPGPGPGPDPQNPAGSKCAGRVATIAGSRGRDRIKGTKKRDVIAGLGGNDVIKGLRGNDLICGGRGKDKLIGGPGKDTLRGDAGKDVLLGGSSKDKLLGGRGGDKLVGGKGRDRCRGGSGKDRLGSCEPARRRR